MVLKAKRITKEDSTEFLGDATQCARHVKLGGMWPMENQLLSLSYINAYFIMLSAVTDVSKLFSQGAFSMLATHYGSDDSKATCARPVI